MNTYDELRVKVVEWANKRGILENSTRDKQYLKTVEELGELAKAIQSGDREQIKMELGDVVVTRILQEELPWEGDPTVFDFRRLVAQSGHRWECTDLAEALGFTLEECLAAAYEKISKRKGRMVDGQFVKEEK